MPTSPSRQTGSVWPNRRLHSRVGSIACTQPACTPSEPRRPFPPLDTPSADPLPGFGEPTARHSGVRDMAGFTLVELVITLSIAAILMAIAVPSFQSVMRTNRIAALTNELVTALQMARSEAVTRGTSVTVCKSNDISDPMPTCKSSANWKDGWRVYVDSSNETLRIGKPSIASASIDMTENSIRFDSSGRVNSVDAAPLTFTIDIGTERRCILIRNIGRISTLKPDPDQPCP